MEGGSGRKTRGDFNELEAKMRTLELKLEDRRKTGESKELEGENEGGTRELANEKTSAKDYEGRNAGATRSWY
jgi:hypothetical protein